MHLIFGDVNLTQIWWEAAQYMKWNILKCLWEHKMLNYIALSYETYTVWSLFFVLLSLLVLCKADYII
jgi:hypothetical protein